MYLLYLDDSGTVGNPQEEYFVLGGICLREEQVHWVTERLDEIAAEYIENPRDVELHASEIFGRRSAPWRALRTMDDARGVIKSVLDVVNMAEQSASVFACAVHKETWNHDPMATAFEDLFSRFDLFLRTIQREGVRHRGLVILDRTAYENVIQQMGQDFLRDGTRWGSLRNIADAPIFVDSRASRAMQLADHIAHAVFRRFNAGDAQYFDIISGRFHQEDGVVHGLAHRHGIDRHQCMCPACLSRRIRF